MAFFEWLQATSVARAIQASTPLTATLSAIHLLGFTLIMGGTLVSSLRLMGALLTEHSVVTITRPATRGVLIGLGISIGTGMFLFAPRAFDAALNSTFRAKMLLLVAASGFQLSVIRAVSHNASVATSTQRLSGLVGLALWLSVAVAGCVFILLE